MPPFKNNDLVHTEGKCKCIVEADEHELPAIGGLAMADSSLLDSSGLDASGLNAAEQDVADQGEKGQVAAAQGLPRHQLFDDEDQGDFDLLKAGSVHYLNLYSHRQEEHQSLYHHHPAE